MLSPAPFLDMVQESAETFDLKMIGTFDLFNRLTFYNEWQTAAGLTLFALVFGYASSRTGPVPAASSVR